MKSKRVFSRIFRGLIYLPKTLYINFKTLPIKYAIKLPYIVMGACSFRGINRNNVKINGNIKTGMIRLAAQKTSKRGLHVNKKTFLIVDNGGCICFNGDASIGAGTSICAHGGKISIGDNFSCNINCFFYSMKSIEIGKNVLLGWNINIRDNDGHPLYKNGVLINPEKPICLGNRIWVASYVDIMKGVNLADGIVIATRSLVTKSITYESTVIAGIPAKIIKNDVIWDYEYDKEE